MRVATTEMRPRLLSIPAAAKLLGISDTKLRRMVEDGKFPSVRIPECRRRMIRVTDLDAYVAGLEETTP